MKTLSVISNECPIYPGGYIPPPEMKNALTNSRFFGQKSAYHPPVKLSEGKEGFDFELIMPGVGRENIHVNVHDTVLSIMVMDKMEELKSNGDFNVEKKEASICDWHFKLKENADSLFTNAQLKHGILYLHVPKSKNPLKSEGSSIVVY